MLPVNEPECQNDEVPCDIPPKWPEDILYLRSFLTGLMPDMMMSSFCILTYTEVNKALQ